VGSVPRQQRKRDAEPQARTYDALWAGLSDFSSAACPAATNPDLAAAVSNAGAMGALALTRSAPESARASVAKVRALTKRRFLVNYLLAFDPVSFAAALDAGAPSFNSPGDCRQGNDSARGPLEQTWGCNRKP